MQLATNRAGLRSNKIPSVIFPLRCIVRLPIKYSPDSWPRNQDLPLENSEYDLSVD